MPVMRWAGVRARDEHPRRVVRLGIESRSGPVGRPELTWPADIYLEGSDQHRGWFQSSLLVGLGTRGHAPYHEVLTHGFIVADDGRKMSKSLGNSIAPQDIIKQSGADILRLWVSMSDYTQEIRLGKEVLARAVEAYRKIRNTLRYLIANLYDFDPAVDSVARERLEEVDRYVLARYGDLARPHRAARTRRTTTGRFFRPSTPSRPSTSAPSTPTFPKIGCTLLRLSHESDALRRQLCI